MGVRVTERSKTTIGFAGLGPAGPALERVPRKRARFHLSEGAVQGRSPGRARTGVSETDEDNLSDSQILDEHDGVVRFVEDQFIHELR